MLVISDKMVYVRHVAGTTVDPMLLINVNHLTCQPFIARHVHMLHLIIYINVVMLGSEM